MIDDDMKRRNFIEASAALLVAMGLPKSSEPEWMQQLTDKGEICGLHFELISPFVVKEEWSDILFRQCTFSAKPGFVGNKLIEGVITCWGYEFVCIGFNPTEPIFVKLPLNWQERFESTRIECCDYDLED